MDGVFRALDEGDGEGLAVLERSLGRRPAATLSRAGFLGESRGDSNGFGDAMLGFMESRSPHLLRRTPLSPKRTAPSREQMYDQISRSNPESPCPRASAGEKNRAGSREPRRTRSHARGTLVYASVNYVFRVMLIDVPLVLGAVFQAGFILATLYNAPRFVDRTLRFLHAWAQRWLRRLRYARKVTATKLGKGQETIGVAPLQAPHGKTEAFGKSPSPTEIIRSGSVNTAGLPDWLLKLAAWAPLAYTITLSSSLGPATERGGSACTRSAGRS